MIEQTTTFYKVPDLVTRYQEGHLPGVNAAADDATAAALDYYRLWIDTPDKPGKYYDHNEGELTIVDDVQDQTPRVERIDSWEEWSDDRKVESILQTGLGQIREYTPVQVQDDETLSAVTAQDSARYTTMVQATAVAKENGALDTMSTDLQDYQASEKDYARTILDQDVVTLTKDNTLISSGVEGILSTDEKSSVVARVAQNRLVADGLSSGVKTDGNGTARQLLRLDNEGNARATFEVIEAYEWPAGTPRYLMHVILSDIDEGIVPVNVWARIYENDGTPINGVPPDANWLPFAENANGTWSTPTIVNYDSLAKGTLTVQRCAVAYLGSQSEDEVTRKVVVVPPATSDAKVRWEGRNGSPTTKKAKKAK